MGDDVIQIEGYPAHDCGGALVPTTKAKRLKCAWCAVFVDANPVQERLARSAEGRALRASASGREIVRVAGRIPKSPGPQTTLFTAQLLEGGPTQLKTGTQR